MPSTDTREQIAEIVLQIVVDCGGVLNRVGDYERMYADRILALAAPPVSAAGEWPKDLAAMPNREPTLRGAREFWVNEEWLCAVNDPTCSARLSCLAHDPDDYRVRVRMVKDDDALLADALARSAAGSAEREAGPWRIVLDPARSGWPGVLLVGNPGLVRVEAGSPTNFADSKALALRLLSVIPGDGEAPAAGSAEREDFFAGDPPPERGIPYPVDLSKLPPPAAGSAEREGESPEALAELISRLTDASWMRHPDEAEDMMVLRALCGEARVALEDYAALRGQGEG